MHAAPAIAPTMPWINAMGCPFAPPVAWRPPNVQDTIPMRPWQIRRLAPAVEPWLMAAGLRDELISDFFRFQRFFDGAALCSIALWNTPRML